MEPQFNKPQQMNLPPATEQSFSGPAGEQLPGPNFETAGGSPQLPAPSLPSQQFNSPVPVFSTPTVNDDVSNATDNDLPAMADDSDLIEKEWVTKAKQIVAENREDPYQQNKAVTLLKADYMQKRYAKTLKLSE